ncbi:hypothetical protein O7606_26400 [Micromonospora sp. WMMD882]|uniref:hypothetical protein n=1 Tax=Micromonospora sp. WMMD882 TaxID=3015151 RepID=UPI00248AECCB|nr:hypothetical protein [Micromonospora sp. WMMD882]WBB79629.1 hypothetical protein O7606_26400 [Micromonospora sp. WMMD882]
MSDAYLSERPSGGGPAPIDLTLEPIRLTHPERDGDEPAARRPRSRRWRVAMAAGLAVGLAGAAVVGVFGWRVAQQKDTVLTVRSEAAGLREDDSERARSTADYLRSGFAASIQLDRSFGVVYQDPSDERRSVLVFGGATLLWQPERELDTLFGTMTDETGAVDELHEVPAGRLGGVMKCGTTRGEGGDFAVCGWADHGSVVMGMFPGRPVSDSAELFRRIREEIQTRP